MNDNGDSGQCGVFFCLHTLVAAGRANGMCCNPFDCVLQQLITVIIIYLSTTRSFFYVFDNSSAVAGVAVGSAAGLLIGVITLFTVLWQ